MVNAFQYRRKACRPERLQITGKFFWRVLFRQQVDELFVPHRQQQPLNHLDSVCGTPKKASKHQGS